jgi:hypothetical protein
MRWLSLFLACQHLSSGTNLRECEDQSWFKVQAVPVFPFDSCKMFSCAPERYVYPRLNANGLRNVGHLTSNKPISFWGYVAVCVQLYYRCFTVLHLVVAVLHYMFLSTWPSSGVYDVLLLYSWRNLLRCFCWIFFHVVILCTFPFAFFCCLFCC